MSDRQTNRKIDKEQAQIKEKDQREQTDRQTWMDVNEAETESKRGEIVTVSERKRET